MTSASGKQYGNFWNVRLMGIAYCCPFFFLESGCLFHETLDQDSGG
jgi:hypothetical protein